MEVTNQLQGQHWALIDGFVLSVTSDPEMTCAELPIFHRPCFFNIHRRSGVDLFLTVSRISDGAIAGSFFLGVNRDSASSPLRGSYGGLHILAPFRCLALVRAFVARLDLLCRALNICRVDVVLPPFAYDVGLVSWQMNSFLEAGFVLAKHELNYAAPVSALSLTRWHHGNRKRLRQCKEEGFTCANAGMAGLAEVYEVLERNRVRNGHVLSMTFAQVRTMFEVFPERMYAHCVRATDGSPAAASISIRIDRDTHYVFYWGECSAFNRSPVVMLADELNRICLQDGVGLLDLGTSSLGGVPNQGLVRFKENLGCEASMKITLSKDL